MQIGISRLRTVLAFVLCCTPEYSKWVNLANGCAGGFRQGTIFRGYHLSTMNKNKRTEIFERWRRANPEPKTELAYNSPFELLISVLLSAQATDVSVNNATKGLYREANNAQAMLDLGEAKVRHHIRTIGLFNTKAKNVIKTCQILVEEHNGEVPRDREALEALPGVGRKTANVVLNTAFREIAMAVDTHIFRVSNRTGIAPGKDVLTVEEKLLKFVPQEFLLDAHHWLILHGRYVCVARKPKCPECSIADLCEFKPKTKAQAAKPAAQSKKKARAKNGSSRKRTPKKRAAKKVALKKKA